MADKFARDSRSPDSLELTACIAFKPLTKAPGQNSIGTGGQYSIGANNRAKCPHWRAKEQRISLIYPA
jgi:hypothetical protein